MSHTPDIGYEDVLSDLDADALATPVGRLLGSETVDVDDWTVEQLHGGVSQLAGNAHYRFTGTGHDDGEAVPWSVVAKVHSLSDVETVTDRDSEREIGFYQFDVAADRIDGFRPVRCLDVQWVDDPVSCWLWLEDLDDAFDGEWPLDQFERTARHLGQFNGAFVEDLPAGEWARPFEFDHGSAGPVVAALAELPDHPGLERGIPPEVRDPLRRVWTLRDQLIDRLALLPQTFCHFDPTPGNLFARRTDDGWETVAIDWEFCGRGPLGADAALLVSASPVARHVDAELLPELDDLVFDAYLDGLDDTGWSGDPEQVRIGYTCFMLAHWLDTLGTLRRPYLDPSTAETFEDLFGVTRETWLTFMAVRARFLADKAEEVFELPDAQDTDDVSRT